LGGSGLDLLAEAEERLLGGYLHTGDLLGEDLERLDLGLLSVLVGLGNLLVEDSRRDDDAARLREHGRARDRARVPHELDKLLLELLAERDDVVEVVRPDDQHALVPNERTALLLASAREIRHRVEHLDLGGRVELDMLGRVRTAQLSGRR
jgi:hypothetical protein